MEFVLQYLDDLDDLCFASVMLLHRLRRLGLSIGFAAALTVLACERLTVGVTWIIALSAISVGMLALWLVGSSLTLVARDERRAPTARA